MDLKTENDAVRRRTAQALRGDSHAFDAVNDPCLRNVADHFAKERSTSSPAIADSWISNVTIPERVSSRVDYDSAAGSRGRSLLRKPDLADLRQSARAYRSASEPRNTRYTDSIDSRLASSRVYKPLSARPRGCELALEESPSWLHGLETEEQRQFDAFFNNVSASSNQIDVLLDAKETPLSLVTEWSSCDETWPDPTTPDDTSVKLATTDPQAIAARLMAAGTNNPNALKDALHLFDVEDTQTVTTWAPAVTHETHIILPHEIIQPTVCNETHQHHYIRRELPVMDINILPARHFVPNVDGDYVELSQNQIPSQWAYDLNKTIADAVSKYTSENEVDASEWLSVPAYLEGCTEHGTSSAHQAMTAESPLEAGEENSEAEMESLYRQLLEIRYDRAKSAGTERDESTEEPLGGLPSVAAMQAREVDTRKLPPPTLDAGSAPFSSWVRSILPSRSEQ